MAWIGMDSSSEDTAELEEKLTGRAGDSLRAGEEMLFIDS